jgi:hypothetical protein
MWDYAVVALPYLITVLAFVLAICLPVMAGYWVRQIASRIGIETSHATLHVVESAVYDAVRFAEEWAHGKVKAGEEKPAGPAKLAEAVAYVIAELTRLGVMGYAKDHVERKIMAALGKYREEAAADKYLEEAGSGDE